MNSEINISAWHREREGGDAAAKIFNFQNLYKAYISCRRHKRNTYHAAEFEVNYESELLKLEEELQDHNYKLGRSICFVVKEPSLREIFAATFRDRVVHHLLYNFLEPVFEPIFNDPIKKFVSKGNRLLFKKIPPYKSLFHVPETQGLPIGNLTSQFFANVYLNKLDQFVKHKLKAKYYLRYVDDFMF